MVRENRLRTLNRNLILPIEHFPEQTISPKPKLRLKLESPIEAQINYYNTQILNLYHRSIIIVYPLGKTNLAPTSTHYTGVL